LGLPLGLVKSILVGAHACANARNAGIHRTSNVPRIAEPVLQPFRLCALWVKRNLKLQRRKAPVVLDRAAGGRFSALQADHLGHFLVPEAVPKVRGSEHALRRGFPTPLVR